MQLNRDELIRAYRSMVTIRRFEERVQELFGKEGGLCGGKGGSMHIADLDVGMLGANGIVGGGPPLVLGAALTAKTLGTGTVAVCFSGDGASNQGTTFEALNMAV